MASCVINTKHSLALKQTAISVPRAGKQLRSRTAYGVIEGIPDEEGQWQSKLCKEGEGVLQVFGNPQYGLRLDVTPVWLHQHD